MSLSHSGWKGRRKRLRRRLGHDLRRALPLLGLVFCLAGSALAIVGVERAPVAAPPVVSSGPRSGGAWAPPGEREAASSATSSAVPRPSTGRVPSLSALRAVRCRTRPEAMDHAAASSCAI